MIIQNAVYCSDTNQYYMSDKKHPRTEFYSDGQACYIDGAEEYLGRSATPYVVLDWSLYDDSPDELIKERMLWRQDDDSCVPLSKCDIHALRKIARKGGMNGRTHGVIHDLIKDHNGVCNMSLSDIIAECMDILQNDEGMYHGWFRLGSSKYQSYIASAVKNPSANDPDEWARDWTGSHWGGSPEEAMWSLLNELRDWKSQGRPFPTWDDYKSTKNEKYGNACAWRIANHKAYIEVKTPSSIERGVYDVYAPMTDVDGNYHWMQCVSNQIEDSKNEKEWNNGPLPSPKEYSASFDERQKS